jgi:hypothetical protein
MIMHNAQEEILNVVKDIRNNEDEGLFGFSIREIDDSYSETGNSVLRMFEKYPEHAELFEEMLGAICCMNFDDIINKMEKERDYYDSL